MGRHMETAHGLQRCSVARLRLAPFFKLIQVLGEWPIPASFVPGDCVFDNQPVLTEDPVCILATGSSILIQISCREGLKGRMCFDARRTSVAHSNHQQSSAIISNHQQSSLIHCNLSLILLSPLPRTWLHGCSNHPGLKSHIFAHFCIQGTETFSRKQSNWKSVKSSGASQSKFHGCFIVVMEALV